MERKKCFGTIEEVKLDSGFTLSQSKPECRNCEEVRDCMRLGKQAVQQREEKEREGKVELKNQEDELRKQERMALILDLSQIISNEIGSSLLEFLNKIYSSPWGTVLFQIPFLIYEIPRGSLSRTLSIPMSSALRNLLQGGGGGSLHVVSIQGFIPNNRRANTGLIGCEVARLFSSDKQIVSQTLEALSDSESDLFKKMEAEDRVNWLMLKWGFREELEAIKKEVLLLKAKKGQ
jgi:hypothetical protein